VEEMIQRSFDEKSWSKEEHFFDDEELFKALLDYFSLYLNWFEPKTIDWRN
jgi:hypothetical protein